MFDRKFKIELQFSVSDIDLNNLYLKTPGGLGGEQPSCNVKIQIAIQKTRKGLCQKSDFGPAYHKLGSYQVSI